MQRIVRDQAMKYEFDHRDEPLMRVAQGESFVVETEDAGSGLVRSADVAPHLMDFPTRNFEPPKGNPIGGPVFVEGPSAATCWRSRSSESSSTSRASRTSGPDRVPSETRTSGSL